MSRGDEGDCPENGGCSPSDTPGLRPAPESCVSLPETGFSTAEPDFGRFPQPARLALAILTG